MRDEEVGKARRAGEPEGAVRPNYDVIRLARGVGNGEFGDFSPGVDAADLGRVQPRFGKPDVAVRAENDVSRLTVGRGNHERLELAVRRALSKDLRLPSLGCWRLGRQRRVSAADGGKQENPRSKQSLHANLQGS